MYDIVIVGAGVVGFAGAMYAGRMGMKTIVIGDLVGGTITLTDVVENYPGFKKLTGQELADKLEEHARDYPVEIVNDKVIDVKKCGGSANCYTIFTEDRSFHAKTILFATGAKHRELNVPGEKELSNKGVHTCALCDGPLYRNKIVGVVGGSDSAAKEALLLTQWAKKVYIIYRGERIRPEPINGQRIEEKIKEGKIEIINNTNVVEIKGEKNVSGVVFDRAYHGSKEFKLDGLFVEIGSIPLSDLAKKLGVKLNSKGEIIIDRAAKTNVSGIFAAGDVVDTAFKQAITGVAEAVLAVYSAYTYINENEIVLPTGEENNNK
jgi:thioredoxin-disulfide reductase